VLIAPEDGGCIATKNTLQEFPGGRPHGWLRCCSARIGTTVAFVALWPRHEKRSTALPSLSSVGAGVNCPRAASPRCFVSATTSARSRLLANRISGAVPASPA